MSAGWAPIRVEWRKGRPVADLCRTAGSTFEEPFFDETIERCLRRPFTLLFRRDVALDELPEPGAEPDGFVLHASRCGSTLVAQLLAATPETLVVSEAGAVDSVLRSRLRGVSDAQRADWLRRVVGSLRLASGDEPERFFIKLDAWAVLDLPLLRLAFPGVPWLFLYRDPLEILVSQERRRGLHMIPHGLPPALFGPDLPDPEGLPPPEYMARVLGLILAAAGAEAHDPARLLLHWRELPRAFFTQVAPRFGLEYTAADEARLAPLTRRHAKNPHLPFEDDSAAKHEAASPALRDAADAWARPAYDALERARLLHARTRAAA